MKVKKNIVFLLCILALVSSASAQTVVIPDARFKACLLSKVPSLMDANQDLIVNEAKTFAGTISCMGFNITDVEGIQYFENITELNLSRNQLSYIGALPVNSVLTRMVLDDNQLSALPALSGLSGLKTLSARRNRITSLPDLSDNKKITQLYVESNQLAVLPELSELKELWAINVSNNKLAHLPALDSLKKMGELVAANNALTEIPSLRNQTVLKFLNIAGNKLTRLPEVADNNGIETIRMERNDFRLLPDFTPFPVLQQAFTNDNHFTYKELIKLTEYEDYLSVFPLSSQKMIQSGRSYEVSEADDLYLKTGIDADVARVTYTWYFEGNEIRKSADDYVRAFTDSPERSGYYYCELTHPDFPDLVLKTDSFFVSVIPCFMAEGFLIEVTPKTCRNSGGRISISTANTLPSGFEYELVSVNTGEERRLANGYFSGLGDSEYMLYGVAGNCRKNIGNRIRIDEEECDNVFITADGDGIDDEYYFNYQGHAVISDKFGNVISELQLPGGWDGTGTHRKVAPGLYFVNINDGEKLIKVTVVY